MIGFSVAVFANGPCTVSSIPCVHFTHRGGPAAEASWHRVALHTAAEQRQHAGQAEGDEEEPRTPSFAHGLAAHARRRSPV